MNNIEILEELIKKANVKDVDMNDVFYGEHIKAIENLIKENKELKENPPIIFKNAEIKIGDEQINKYIGKNYIPKSKVKEKIEEYRYLMQNPKEAEHYVAWYSRRIEILEELLKGE